MYHGPKPPDTASEEAPPDYIRFLRDEAASDPMLKAEYERLTKQGTSAAAITPTGRDGVAAPATIPNAPAANPGNSTQTAAADAFDAAAFDVLPLRDKLDKAAHASLAFKMALIASTDVATASDTRIKAALSAAQSVILTKARVDEVGLTRTPGPDRAAEHLARWEKLKRERVPGIDDAPERENAARVKQPVIAGSSSAITGNS